MARAVFQVTPMFFLVRCIFWLAVLAFVLPWDGISLRSEIAEQAESAGKAVVDKAQSLCLENPVACAQHANEAARLLGQTPSQNTLNPTDLAPAWRGNGQAAPLPPRRPG